MDDEVPPENGERLTTADFNAPIAIPPEVEVVLPPAAYDSVMTDDELAPRPLRPGEPALAGPTVDHRPLLEGLVHLGETLTRRLDALQSAFEREVRAEATREKVVDRLHAELQEYKQDLLLNALRPLLVDLIQLHDDMGKIVAGNRDADGDAARLLGLMQGFRQGIEDILYRQGVETFQVDGDAFDPRRQRAASTTPCDEPALARTVAARLRPGFQAGERVLRPEIVSVYTLPKAAGT